MTVIETLLISTIPAVVGVLITLGRFQMEAQKFHADTMAERAARHFLENQRFKARTFTTLKKYLGGWDKDEDGLRRILMRAGAIRQYRKEADGSATELWVLLGGNKNYNKTYAELMAKHLPEAE